MFTASPTRRAREGGTASAEYAVGMLGAACIGCIVAKMGADGWNGWIADIFGRLSDIGAWLSVWSTPWRGPR